MAMEMSISPPTVTVTPIPRQTATCQRGMLPGSMRPGDRNRSMRRGLTAIAVETATANDATATTGHSTMVDDTHPGLWSFRSATTGRRTIPGSSVCRSDDETR